jgi:hypothetical protein
MAKRRITSSIAMFAAVAFTSLMASGMPATAKSKEPVGLRINVLRGVPSSYPAGQPFHVGHGWSACVGLADDLLANGRLGFELEVDGVTRAPSYVDVSVLPKETTGLPCDVINRSTVYNFPAGLPAGAHTLIGHWTGPCKPLFGDDQYDALCENPAEVVDASFSPATHVVTFS